MLLESLFRQALLEQCVHGDHLRLTLAATVARRAAAARIRALHHLLHRILTGRRLLLLTLHALHLALHCTKHFGRRLLTAERTLAG